MRDRRSSEGLSAVQKGDIRSQRDTGIASSDSSCSNVGDVWSLVDFQLPLTFPQQKLNGAEILSIPPKILLEFPASERLEIASRPGWLLSRGAKTLTVECEDVTL